MNTQERTEASGVLLLTVLYRNAQQPQHHNDREQNATTVAIAPDTLEELDRNERCQSRDRSKVRLLLQAGAEFRREEPFRPAAVAPSAQTTKFGMRNPSEFSTTHIMIPPDVSLLGNRRLKVCKRGNRCATTRLKQHAVLTGSGPAASSSTHNAQFENKPVARPYAAYTKEKRKRLKVVCPLNRWTYLDPIYQFTKI